MMPQMKIAALTALAALALTGCGADVFSPVRSVEFYDQHPDDRAAVLAKCDAEPGLYLSEANCQFADKSRQRSQSRINGTGGKGYSAPSAGGGQ